MALIDPYASQYSDEYGATGISADPGSLSIPGGDVSLIRDAILAAGAGSLPITGSDAGIIHSVSQTFMAEPGSLDFTFTDASFLATRKIDALSGSLPIVGFDASILGAPPILIAESGSLPITGSDVTFTVPSKMVVVCTITARLPADYLVAHTCGCE